MPLEAAAEKAERVAVAVVGLAVQVVLVAHLQ